MAKGLMVPQKRQPPLFFFPSLKQIRRAEDQKRQEREQYERQLALDQERQVQQQRMAEEQRKRQELQRLELERFKEAQRRAQELAAREEAERRHTEAEHGELRTSEQLGQGTWGTTFRAGRSGIAIFFFFFVFFFFC